MCIATNGVLVTDEVVGRMKESGIRICSLSLDGFHRGGPTTTSASSRGRSRRHCGRRRSSTATGCKFIVNSSLHQAEPARHRGHLQAGEVDRAHAWYMFMIVPTGRGQEIMERC